MSKTRPPASKAQTKRPSNPFDSDSDDDLKSGPMATKGISSSTNSVFSSGRSHYKNDFLDSGGIENQSVQELENYAVYKAKETTQTANKCVSIAEEIRGTASTTLVMLDQQGEQIYRTHGKLVDIDQDLSRGETLLGSLGGLFQRKWKPTKNVKIKGPTLTRDDSFIKKSSHIEQRKELGISDQPAQNRRSYEEPVSALDKVEIEKRKQDDALDDLSNILGELKGMAIDMGNEIGRQTKALSDMEPEVDELGSRVKGASARTRRLLGK